MNNLRTFRRCYAALCVAALLICLTSCTAIRRIEDAATKAGEILTEVKASVAEFKQHATAADTDKDGETSIAEWLAYLTTGGGAAFLAWLKLKASRLTGDREAHKERTAALEAKVAEMEKKA